jgi:hypothetical protein
LGADEIKTGPAEPWLELRAICGSCEARRLTMPSCQARCSSRSWGGNKTWKPTKPIIPKTQPEHLSSNEPLWTAFRGESACQLTTPEACALRHSSWTSEKTLERYKDTVPELIWFWLTSDQSNSGNPRGLLISKGSYAGRNLRFEFVNTQWRPSAGASTSTKQVWFLWNLPGIRDCKHARAQFGCRLWLKLKSSMSWPTIRSPSVKMDRPTSPAETIVSLSRHPELPSLPSHDVHVQSLDHYKVAMWNVVQLLLSWHMTRQALGSDWRF